MMTLSKKFLRFHLSFTCVKKIHRMYVCTCLTHAAKMTLFTVKKAQ